MQLRITSTSPEGTEKIAHSIGQSCRGGEVIELVSDLGGGKTTFVRGLAEGMGSHDIVHSPSFTLSNQYSAKDLTLFHFDFYRLHDPGITAHELEEVSADPKTVVVIEWAKIVENVLSLPHVIVTFKPKADSIRDITIDYPKQFSYLITDIT